MDVMSGIFHEYGETPDQVQSPAVVHILNIFSHPSKFKFLSLWLIGLTFLFVVFRVQSPLEAVNIWGEIFRVWITSPKLE